MQYAQPAAFTLNHGQEKSSVMPLRVRLAFVGIGCMLSSTPLAAAPPRCAPTNVPVTPVAGTNLRVYQGRTPSHVIRFTSERPGEPVEVFPEPPVRIVHRGTGAQCEIREGGVWARSGVYVGAGGSRFLLLEGSGSNAALVFYDANTCARLGEVDVSEARWRFVDSGVEVGRDCTGTTMEGCRTRRATPLGSNCAVVGK